MRRSGTRRPGPARNQILVAQPGQQIAADLLAEDDCQTRPVDRLMIGDGSEHAHLNFGEGQRLLTKISGGLDRVRKLGPGRGHFYAVTPALLVSVKANNHLSL